jgi:hypothetical protein
VAVVRVALGIKSVPLLFEVPKNAKNLENFVISI